MDSPPNKTYAPVSSSQHTNGSLHSKAPPASLTPRLPLTQIAIVATYPITVLLGLVSNHPPDSYFARRDNFINVYFLKFAWFWTSIAFFAHVVRVPRKVAPLVRYLAATVVWYLVTQWCFGPPIMDKVFRGTGGICQLAKDEDFPKIFTSAVCRSSGGAWSGGHDLVYFPSVNLSDRVEWSYICTYSCVFILVVGVVATFLNARFLVDDSNQGSLDRFD